MFEVFVSVYGTILAAEMVGDKTFWSSGALATKYRVLSILAGSTAAFMLKMFAAVVLGRFIARLPPLLVAAMSMVAFFGMAVTLWRKRPAKDALADDKPSPTPYAALLVFSSIFFSEWGDVGQITAAVLAARYHLPVVVWTAATLAMVTKCVLGLTVGLGLRRWIPERALRIVSVAACVLMGAHAAFEAFEIA